MTFAVETVTSKILDLLRDGGDWNVGDARMPDGVGEGIPYGILEQIPGGFSTGGMAGNQEQAQLIYQLKTVGGTATQCRRLRDVFYELIESEWRSITYIMGPPTISSGGIVRDDERTFESNDTIYLEVTAV